ncbi:ABC transporter ATP-binding protein [Saliphagus infecundisoli]|uniref:ABC-type D-xylose/L-arabinose transporter n=1 Tax=Saliphagus infecundisoli TaxID=1849069 RepID=A0ABD5QAW5_9EURY|nr:ABC transporter ATP-binding protein [Saliphagus infecundisoli]
MAQVTLKDITKKYGDVQAVENMDLEIKDGEFVCLVGPSGCGKSTTLEMMAGLTEPSAGTVTIGDRDVTYLPPKDRNIAMVFQNIALFPHMSVYENASFGLSLRKIETEEIDQRVEQALETVEMSGTEDRMPDELSGGQRQRVAIARAIVRDPDVFLMDEPLANLDAKLRVHMRTELQRIHKELGTTIIYVTHDQAEAMTMSDRIAVLNEGKLQQLAPPLECYNQPANEFVASFIGSPSMNMVKGTISHEGIVTEEFSLPASIADGDGLNIDQSVIIGIRPEDLYPASNAEQAGDPTPSVDARVEVLEPMGENIFVYLDVVGEEVNQSGMEGAQGASQLLMSVDPSFEVSEDDHLPIVFDREKIHLFDANSGEAICHQISTKATPDEITTDGE